MSKFTDFLHRCWRSPYVRHPLIGLGALMLLIVASFLLLSVFTRHGEEYAIPNLSRLTLSQAEEMAAPLQLRLEVTDSSYNITQAPGTILSQFPAAGEKVKKGRRVFLSINASRPQMVEVPDTKHNAYRQAIYDLERHGFPIGKISFVYSEVYLPTQSQDEPEDLLADDTLSLAQAKEPIAHLALLGLYHKGEQLNPERYIVPDSLPKGTPVDISIGLDPTKENKNIIPEVKNKTFAEARKELAFSLFNVGTVLFDETVKDISDSLAARVYFVHPTPGETRPYGSAVTLRLTLNDGRIN